jgi:hypothetical protein
MDAELVCDYKRVAVLRHGGAQKTAESLPKMARGHGVTLDVNVFAKLEGRGLGQPWRLWWLMVVTRKLAAVMVLGWDSTMARAAFGGALSLGTLSTVAVGPREAPLGEESTWEGRGRRLELGAGAWCLCQNEVISGRF